MIVDMKISSQFQVMFPSTTACGNMTKKYKITRCLDITTAVLIYFLIFNSGLKENRSHYQHMIMNIDKDSNTFVQSKSSI